MKYEELITKLPTMPLEEIGEHIKAQKLKVAEVRKEHDDLQTKAFKKHYECLEEMEILHQLEKVEADIRNLTERANLAYEFLEGK